MKRRSHTGGVGIIGIKYDGLLAFIDDLRPVICGYIRFQSFFNSCFINFEEHPNSCSCGQVDGVVLAHQIALHVQSIKFKIGKGLRFLIDDFCIGVFKCAEAKTVRAFYFFCLNRIIQI